MKTYKAILFDLDGTLVDSVTQLTLGINALMQSVRMRAFSTEEISRMIGKGVRVLLERVCDARGIFPTEATLTSMQKQYERYVRELDPSTVRFFPGALESIREMRAMGLRTVLVTNKSREMTMDFVRKHALVELFDRIYTADDVCHPKPNGEMLQKACLELGCKPDEALMVGDSRNDALAARDAGVDVVLVRTGYNEGVPIDQWARTHGFANVEQDVAAVCAWLKSNKA